VYIYIYIYIPQGSVLDPYEFAAYTEDITELTDHHAGAITSLR